MKGNEVIFNTAGTGGWIPAFKEALLVLDSERICFGLDYPWEMGRPSDYKAFINDIKSCDIPEDDKMNILGGNIIRLFKLLTP